MGISIAIYPRECDEGATKQSKTQAVGSIDPMGERDELRFGDTKEIDKLDANHCHLCTRIRKTDCLDHLVPDSLGGDV